MVFITHKFPDAKRVLLINPSPYSGKQHLQAINNNPHLIVTHTASAEEAAALIPAAEKPYDLVLMGVYGASPPGSPAHPAQAAEFAEKLNGILPSVPAGTPVMAYQLTTREKKAAWQKMSIGPVEVQSFLQVNELVDSINDMFGTNFDKTTGRKISNIKR